MISRYEIAEIARSYVGTPFVHKGRAKGKALDCVGLPICTKREMGGLWADGSSPNEEFDYGRQMAQTELLEICRKKFHEKHKDQIAVGDLVVLANDTVPGHVAIVGEHNGGHRDGYLTLIHCVNTHRHKCVEHILAPHWRESIVAVFEFPQEVTDHAKLAITIGAAVLGAALGVLLPGVGALIGAELGALAGSIIGGLAFPGKIEGPHLSDSRSLTSSYGVPIPRGWGLASVAGQMIDDSGLIEHRHENGGSGQPTVVTYTQSWTGAVAFGAGAGRIRRIWCDGKCVHDATGISDTSSAKGWTIRTYGGDENQTPDSALEALHGVGNVPAYRGLIYCVFDDVALDNFGQHRPSIIKAEVAFGDQLSLRVADVLSAQGRINDGVLSTVAYDVVVPGLAAAVSQNGWSNHVGMYEGGGGASAHVWTTGSALPYNNAGDAITSFGALQRRTDWDGPITGAGIGGSPATMVISHNGSGNLVLTTTGTAGLFCDALVAQHFAGAVNSSHTNAFTDITMVLDSNQDKVQCHEFDTLFIIGGRKYNGSMQIDFSRNGILQVGVGGGGWADTPLTFGRLAAGRYVMRAEYFLDQTAHHIVFVAFTFNGTRHALNITQTANTTDWTDGGLHVQLQEDINSHGGTVVTTYENVAVTLSSSDAFAYSVVEHNHEYHGCIWSFSGAASIPDHLQLKILSSVPGIPGISGIARSAGIWWSADNGSNWHQIYDAVARGKQWDYVTLPAGTDPNHVQVMAFMDAHDDMAHYVYEVQQWEGRTLSGADLASQTPGILDLAGYDPSEYDLSHLAGTLTGFMIGNTSTARDAIIPLMQVCFFEAVESDFKLKFVSRGVPAPGTIQVASSLAAGSTALQSVNHIAYYVFGAGYNQIGIVDAIADEVVRTSAAISQMSSSTSQALCIDPEGFIWIGGGITPGVVCRVDPAALQVVKSINVADDACFPLNALVAWGTSTGKYLLAGYGAFSSLSLIDRVNNWEINDDTSHNGEKQIAPANGGTSGLTAKTICREPVIDADGNAWVAVRLTSTHNLKLTRITPVQATVTDAGGHHHADIPQTTFDLGTQTDWDVDQNNSGGLLYDPYLNALLMSFSGVTRAWSLDTEDWLSTTGDFVLDRYSYLDGGYFVTVTGSHELTVVNARDLSILQVVDLTAAPYSWGGSGLGNAQRFPLDWSLLTVWVMDTNRKLYHITLGGAAAVVGLAGDAGVIDADDLLPQSEGKPIRVTETRIQEQELPARVTVRYNDYSRNYDPASQSDFRRDTTSTKDAQEIQVPVTLTANVAKRIASRMLYTVWATRDKKQFKTLPKHMLLDPLDTGFLNYKGHEFPIRLRQSNLGGDLSLEISTETNENADAVHYSKSTGSAGTPPDPPTISALALTDLIILDTPLLRDADANDALSGGYFAGHPDSGGTWTGFVLLSSPDNVDFSETLETSTNQPSYGTVASALADHPTGSYWDRDDTNSITVIMANGTLSSVTDTDVQNGKNWCVLGSEVLAFKTVVDNGGGSYTLSNLYRGLRGTEWAAPSHGSSETFVLILQSDNAVKREAGSTSLIGTTRYYKAVTINDTLASASSVSHATSGNDLKPYAPYLITADQASSGDIEIGWSRRTRYGGKWNGFTQGLSIVPLNEAHEAYEIDIIGGSPVAVKRTLTSDTPSVVYTRAQQIADFGSEQSSIHVKVYQMSATVGRGFAGEKTVGSFAGSTTGTPVASAAEKVSLLTTGAGDLTFALDTASSWADQYWLVKKVDSGAGKVKVVAHVTSPVTLIESYAEYDLVNQYDWVRLYSDGISVFIAGSNA